MSYDLMVFKKEAAPLKRVDFMQWYNAQAEWGEDHGYDDPANTSAELRNWFMEVIKTFPAMNGPYSNPDDGNENVSDYCIGREVIYVAFGWPVAEQAYIKMFELAEKNGVGFFDVSSDIGGIYFPGINGELKAIDGHENTSADIKKPWWKFW